MSMIPTIIPSIQLPPQPSSSTPLNVSGTTPTAIPIPTPSPSTSQPIPSQSHPSQSHPTENAFWNNLLSDVLFPQMLTDSRFTLDSPDEEVWIPSDQTIHWGKRPNYIYPTIKMNKKDDLPNVPRGSRLVAKLWFSEWAWTDDDKQPLDPQTIEERKSRPDPTSCPCFEDEKTMVPFEKGMAVFRHLRVAKNIKLKKTETFTISAFGFEIGYHNPFTKTPFKSLEIFLSKPVRIHIVAHKGSVKLMQKHGLLPQNIAPKDYFDESKKYKTENNNNNQKRVIDLEDFEEDDVTPVASLKRSMSTLSESIADYDVPKRLRTTSYADIIEEISSMQQQLENLKKKVYDAMTAQNSPSGGLATKRIQVHCPINKIRPHAFIFFAFRTHNLELGVNLIKFFNFNINERNTTGYTILHSAAKHAFPEGVAWCLQNGASVNATTALRCTPLHLAYLRNDKQVRKLLKEAKADRDALNVYGLKPKDYKNARRALIRPMPETASCVDVVLEGFDHPFTIEIWFAARVGWLEVMKLFIDSGCDVDVKNTNGQTPLMCACEHRQEAMVAYLLSLGADPNTRDIHDSTPLHYAYMCFDQCKSIPEMLEKAGADHSVKNIFNRNPIWYKNKTLGNHWNPIWNI